MHIMVILLNNLEMMQLCLQKNKYCVKVVSLDTDNVANMVILITNI